MSLPWKVKLILFIQYLFSFRWIISVYPCVSIMGENRPLSGPTKKWLPASTVIGLLLPPTPGSTTPTWTVPAGKYLYAFLIIEPPSWIEPAGS